MTADSGNGTAGVTLENLGSGVFAAPGARIIDRSGRKKLPIGDDGFVTAMRGGTLVDKTMLLADMLDSNYKVTLFCRPRRFGKTLNMTMMRAFFESPDSGGFTPEEAKAVFAHTEVWDADGGAWREKQGSWPVVHLSLRTAKGDTWAETLGALRALILAEFQRHDYLLESDSLPVGEADYLERIMTGQAVDEEYADSLLRLARDLKNHHSAGVVVLIDEYDAPVMAAYSAPGGGYYREAVGFLKRWLTGALKDGGEALAFACLTGVQRISKESIFSDLNNLRVSTPLEARFDERYGFTDAEVEALATYLGHPGCMPEAREWYDGYRFGGADVYNPWSVISYLDAGCVADVYWGNTSGNSVVGELVAGADASTLADVYSLLDPDGEVWAPLDLGLVFPDVGLRENALWSMLYLAGYVTTDDVDTPNDTGRLRPLRVPDKEIARIFRAEVIERFRSSAGGPRRLMALQEALVSGNEVAFGSELARIARDSASFHDLTDEASCHMLLMGLAFGTPGYLDPVSNRETGYGRNDFRLAPDPLARGRWAEGPRPLVTVEVKFLGEEKRPKEASALAEALGELAQEGLAQIGEGAYDAQLPPAAQGRVRWGVAFAGKRVAVACERLA